MTPFAFPKSNFHHYVHHNQLSASHPRSMTWARHVVPDGSTTDGIARIQRNDDLYNYGTSDDDEDEVGSVHIPSAGFSVSDEIDESQKDRFVTAVVPIKGISGAAQLVTTSVIQESFEPVRYVVALSPPQSAAVADVISTNDQVLLKQSPSSFVIVDVPPYSPNLVASIKSFIGSNASVIAMIITNKDSIHYDDAPAVYSMRRVDLDLWKQAFPDMAIVGYRLDVPRDCRAAVTQVLDGYGPFALQEDSTADIPFVETGRPLTYEEWKPDVLDGVLKGITPPDEASTTDNTEEENAYTLTAIRQREIGKRVLAVYTPGHTFGSVSYVFPEMGVACTGFVMPVEDNRLEENEERWDAGPTLDCRGYITTSRVGVKRQMESARKFVDLYADRFRVVLPSRGDPLFLDGDTEDRKDALLQILSQFEKIGEIYEQLGIVSDNEIDDFE